MVVPGKLYLLRSSDSQLYKRRQRSANNNTTTAISDISRRTELDSLRTSARPPISRLRAGVHEDCQKRLDRCKTRMKIIFRERGSAHGSTTNRHHQNEITKSPSPKHIYKNTIEQSRNTAISSSTNSSLQTRRRKLTVANSPSQTHHRKLSHHKLVVANSSFQ